MTLVVSSTRLEQLRSFVAVEIPEDVKDEIARLTARLARAGYPVRWVNRSNLHLTLVFLGENPPEFISRVKDVLPKVAARVACFQWSLKNLGVFPNLRAPRVVWLGVDQGRSELTGLAGAVQQELVTIGLVPEARPFSAHLTIGRTRGPLPEASKLVEMPYASRSFSADRFILFRSQLRPTGPVYEALAEYPLLAARPA